MTDASISEINDAFARAIKALKPFGSNLVARGHPSHFEALMARGNERDAARAAVAAFTQMRPTLD